MGIMNFMHYIYTGLAVTGGIILYQLLKTIIKSYIEVNKKMKK